MKNNCQRIRQALPNYLHGHVFSMSRARIERHLQRCVVCRSEFEAIRRAEETRQILKDLHEPDGVVGRMKEGVFALGRLKKVLYRPLWIMGIILIVAAVYHYAVTPRQLDLEIDRIVKTEPSATMTTSSPALTSQQVAASPAIEPLLITITPNNDATAVKKINEAMRGHGTLWTVKFSDTIKEVSGSLTPEELTVFFNRIAPSAKISFDRKQFKSIPQKKPIPFVLKLQAAPKPVERTTPSTHRAEQAAPSTPEAAPSTHRAEQAATDMPTSSPASRPAEQATTPAAESVPTSPAGQ